MCGLYDICEALAEIARYTRRSVWKKFLKKTYDIIKLFLVCFNKLLIVAS